MGESCSGCGHPLSWHFRDVSGVARCTVIHSGVSDRGIIGIPWSERCQCADFVTPPKPPQPREELPEKLKEILRKAAAKTIGSDDNG